MTEISPLATPLEPEGEIHPPPPAISSTPVDNPDLEPPPLSPGDDLSARSQSMWDCRCIPIATPAGPLEPPEVKLLTTSFISQTL